MLIKPGRDEHIDRLMLLIRARDALEPSAMSEFIVLAKVYSHVVLQPISSTIRSLILHESLYAACISIIITVLIIHNLAVFMCF